MKELSIDLKIQTQNFCSFFNTTNQEFTSSFSSYCTEVDSLFDDCISSYFDILYKKTYLEEKRILFNENPQRTQQELEDYEASCAGGK